jgi:hypothetical protein
LREPWGLPQLFDRYSFEGLISELWSGPFGKRKVKRKRK